MTFAFVLLQVGEGVPSDKEVKRYVEKALEKGKTYKRFALVPVKPRSVVLRIDFKKKRPVSIRECAFSKKVSNLDGSRSLAYCSSHLRDWTYDIMI